MEDCLLHNEVCNVRPGYCVPLVTVSLNDLVRFALLVRFISLAFAVGQKGRPDDDPVPERTSSGKTGSRLPVDPTTNTSIHDLELGFRIGPRLSGGMVEDSLQTKLVGVGNPQEPGVEWFEEDGEVFVRGLGEACRTDEDELGFLLEVWYITEDVEE